MQARPYLGAHYFGKAQLEATNASRRDGIDHSTEARWRSTTSKLVKATLKTLKLPDWVYETSMNYINRFFLTRSISKNDRHLVVGGAILLAAKVQESPRSVQDIAYVLLQLKHANKQKPQHVPDQSALEHFKEGVTLAEQAVLFSLNFNLNVETHVSLARRLLEPLDLWAKANPPPEEAEANQLKLSLYSAVMFFLNDSASTNLSLQYPNHKVAPVTLIMAAKRIAAARYTGKEVPAALQRVLALSADAEWYDAKGLTLDMAADIEAQINELYATAPVQPAAQQQNAAAQAQQQQATAQAQQRQQEPAAAAQQALPSAGPAPVSQQAPVEAPSAVPEPAGAAAAAARQESIEEGEVLVSSAEDAGPTAPPAAATHVQPACPATSSALGLGAAEQHAACAAAHEQASGTSAEVAPGGAAHAAFVDPSPPAAAAGEAAAMGASPARVCAADSRGAGEAAGGPSASQQRACKRLSDGDECGAGGDEHATSELQAKPVPPPEAAEAGEVGGTGGAACRENTPDSADQYCSPNGLTNGDASNSGGGHVGGQAEVCSRADAAGSHPQQQQQQQPGACIEGDGGDKSLGQQQRPKRCRSGDGATEGEDAADYMADGDSARGAVAKAPRLEHVEGMVV